MDLPLSHRTWRGTLVRGLLWGPLYAIFAALVVFPLVVLPVNWSPQEALLAAFYAPLWGAAWGLLLGAVTGFAFLGGHRWMTRPDRVLATAFAITTGLTLATSGTSAVYLFLTSGERLLGEALSLLGFVTVVTVLSAGIAWRLLTRRLDVAGEAHR